MKTIYRVSFGMKASNTYYFNNLNDAENAFDEMVKDHKRFIELSEVHEFPTHMTSESLRFKE